jgi:hypothetical protein
MQNEKCKIETAAAVNKMGSSFCIFNLCILHLFPARLDLSLQGDGFLIVGVNLDGASGVSHGLPTVANLQKDATEKNVSVDGLGFPEDGRLKRTDGSLLVAEPLVDAAN